MKKLSLVFAGSVLSLLVVGFIFVSPVNADEDDDEIEIDIDTTPHAIASEVL